MNTLCSMWKTFNDEEDPSVRRLRKPSISNNEVSSTTSIRPLVLVIVAARKETKLKNAYFFALHLVQQLLLRGYRIRIAVSSATISEPSSVIKVSQQASQESDVESIFMKLSGAENSLEVTDISDQYTDLEYSFSGNVKAVFLVSWSPVSLSPEALEDPGNNMITRIDRILTMCQNVTTVKKLLITSCLVAITDDFDQSKVYSEADWNDQSSAVADHYAHSKVLVEKRALEFAAGLSHSFKVASIVPGIMLGPHLVEGGSAFGYRYLTRFINTQRVYPNVSYLISDVRDVANAHILAMEQPELSGRFLVSHKALHLSAVLQAVHENFHDLRVSNYMVRDFVVRATHAKDKSFRGQFLRKNVGKVLSIDTQRAKEAGMMLRPQVQTIVETVRYIVDNNLLLEDGEEDAAAGGRSPCCVS